MVSDRAAGADLRFEILRGLVLGLVLRSYSGRWDFAFGGDVPPEAIDGLLRDGFVAVVGDGSRIDITEHGRDALFARTKDTIRTAMKWLKASASEKDTF